MNKLSDSVINYLRTLKGDHNPDGYLCFNDNQEIVCTYGYIGNTNLKDLDCTVDPLQSIPLLQGLIPEKNGSTTIIRYAHVDGNQYFDIHLFGDYLGTWILFINSTRNAHLLQEEQQIRLANIYENEKRRTGS